MEDLEWHNELIGDMNKKYTVVIFSIAGHDLIHKSLAQYLNQLDQLYRLLSDFSSTIEL